FLRYLYGITDKHRITRLREIAALRAEETAAAAARLAESALSAGDFPGRQVIIAGTGTAEKAAAALGVEVKRLTI
ncbi:MAG: hypothetical protein LBP29_00590, partial [Treponema sp.]|nr:hypothetical protein [Treponema sp.]